ncbi:hypothetical protein GJ744_002742 [Endocarpon pusillum]|uniref:RBR-type E3 ubiquitin transferase n=1 Tax=Endocarpon pusillum TaxID=364733 RepID=A0A8H7AR55_9EURO|nr:hypothetical protein GJ744_002742 [Endocarpon pusillum]
MVFRITRGEEICFSKGCDEILGVDKFMIVATLLKLPKLLADYLEIIGRQCIVCEAIVPRSTRPATLDCTHDANVCKTCLRQMIDSLIDSNKWNSLLCPQLDCREKLKLEDVQAFGSSSSYETFEERLLQRTLKDIPGYMACKRGNRLCTSGQIHLPGTSQPKMICTRCQFASCFTCKIPWHENRTCAQNAFLLTDWGSEEYKLKYCKKCPRSGCGAPTKKYKACHEMDCANGQCGTSWCWECKVVLDNSVSYEQRARSQHLSSCTAPYVVSKKGQAGFSSTGMPSVSDGRYREGWNQDPGFIGTGEEY